MNASGMLCAKNSSSFSTSSTSTVLICPVLRSSSAPRGAWARWSITRHRTSNSVLYAPLCDSTLEAAKHAYCTMKPTAVSRALSRSVCMVQVPAYAACMMLNTPRYATMETSPATEAHATEAKR